MTNNCECCWCCKSYSTNDKTGYCKKKKADVGYEDYCEKFADLWTTAKLKANTK